MAKGSQNSYEFNAIMEAFSKVTSVNSDAVTKTDLKNIYSELRKFFSEQGIIDKKATAANNELLKLMKEHINLINQKYI